VHNVDDSHIEDLVVVVAEQVQGQGLVVSSMIMMIAVLNLSFTATTTSHGGQYTQCCDHLVDLLVAGVYPTCLEVFQWHQP
jgi:hypothetical protein